MHWQKNFYLLPRTVQNQGEFEDGMSFLQAAAFCQPGMCFSRTSSLCNLTFFLCLFLSFSSNKKDENAFSGEQGEEQEQEQEEGFEDIFPDAFEDVNVESDNSFAFHEEKPTVSCRNSAPACDFDDNDCSLTCAFPHVFPLGQAHGRSTGLFNREQLNHLFTQFHQAPAGDRKLLACVFDDKRRTQTSLGVNVLSKGNSKACGKMDEAVNAP
jgi:hypothetical protein